MPIAASARSSGVAALRSGPPDALAVSLRPPGIDTTDMKPSGEYMICAARPVSLVTVPSAAIMSSPSPR